MMKCILLISMQSSCLKIIGTHESFQKLVNDTEYIQCCIFIEGLKECFAMMKIMFHLCLNPQMSVMLKYYTVRMIVYCY